MKRTVVSSREVNIVSNQRLPFPDHARSGNFQASVWVWVDFGLAIVFFEELQKKSHTSAEPGRERV